LVEGPALLALIVGSHRSGKSSLVWGFREHQRSFPFGPWTFHIDDAAEETWRAVFRSREATPRPERGPARASIYAITEPETGRRASLMLWDLAGEMFETVNEVLAQPFVPFLDLVIITVPPSDLSVRTDPETDARTGGRDSQGAYAQWLATLNSRFKSIDKPRLVVLALTKCDVYKGPDGFPHECLNPRYRFARAAPPGQATNRQNVDALRAQWERESLLLFEFMRGAGAEGIASVTSQFCPDYQIVAVSGTRKEEEPPPERPEAAVPALAGAPDRAGDPFAMALWMHGWGADLEKQP
jgi:hypothetical protein